MDPRRDDDRAALAAFVREQTGAAEVRIEDVRRLSGGAIQNNFALDLTLAGGTMPGERVVVLRTDAQSRLASSASRDLEYALLVTAHAHGVRVPRPLWRGDGFFVMERVDGTAAAYRLVRDDTLVPDRPLLAEELGENLARIHTIVPPVPALAELPVPAGSPALEAVERLRGFLDALGAVRPVIEYGLAWAARNPPDASRTTLVHGDYRTGNYLVDRGHLAAVLDWEFAHFGDPVEDVGWFFAKCWRFGRADRVAGGIAAAEDFLRGYERVAHLSLDRAAIRYWELMAHVRWAVIALQQAERHLSGEEPSLELALTGRLVPELELEVLALAADRVPA